MKKDVDLGKDAARPSGAPTAGGATTPGSVFGGRTLVARAWRMLARIARDLEATAYRRLREMEDRRKNIKSHPGDAMEPGAPKRVKRTAERKRPPRPAHT
jgi:hypothetical protein